MKAAHRDRPQLPGDRDQHLLLVRPRRPGVRRLLRGRRARPVPRPRAGAARARNRAPTRCATRRSSPASRCRWRGRSTRWTAPPRPAISAPSAAERRAPPPLDSGVRWPLPERPRTHCESRSSALARPASTRRSTCSSARSTTVEVDLFDRLPTPFGLVRAGVAPDHPKIKSVTRVYEKTAAAAGLSLLRQRRDRQAPEPAELAERYHAVIYAYGTATDRRLGIPGEDLAGSHPATHFVAWYNAHPDFADREFDLSYERAVVIGNGNVAADVARMLALTREELEETDTADHAIEALADSGIKEIVVLGRRGPAQAAFTNPEVRELGEMVDADIIVDPADVRARRGQPQAHRLERSRSHQRPQRRDLHRASPSASRRASAGASSCASSARRSRCAARARSRAS